MDQFYVQFPGLYHRCALHHSKGIELCVKALAEVYGADETRAAAKLHVVDDLGRIPADWTEMESDCWYPISSEEENAMLVLLQELYGSQ